MFPRETYVAAYEQYRVALASQANGDALAAAEVGFEAAAEAGDRYTEIFFGLRLAQLHLATVELGAAQEVLVYLFGAACLESASELEQLQIAGQRAEDLHDLRAQVLYTVGRWQASRGQLGTGLSLLQAARSLLAERASPYLSRDELTLLVAEILLDRGDLARLEVLWQHGRSIGATDGEPSLLQRWLILRATQLHMKGALSEAHAQLQSIGRESEALWLRARFQQANVLAALNRMDECEEALLDVFAHEPLQEQRDLLRSLVQARRALPLDLPPSAKQLLAPACAELPELPPPDHESDGDELTLRRSSERLRDEWTRHAQAILLALYAEDYGSALWAAARLDAVIADVDSPLLRARQDYLMALVCSHVADFPQAQQRATAAWRSLSELDVSLEAWAACRLLRYLQRDLGQASASELQELKEQEQRLLLRVRSQLTPADDVAFLTNKPTVMDEHVAELCTALRAITRPGMWSRDGRVRRLADQILQLRRWHDRARIENPRQDLPATEAHDVYAWVHQQLVSRRPSVAERYSATTLHPGWFPRDALLVIYLALPEALEVLLFSRRGWALLPARPLPRQRLRDDVRDVLQKLRRHGVWPGSRSQEHALQRLADTLRIPEIVALLPDKVPLPSLYICPDDASVHVPWAALPLAGRPLVERVVPSLLLHPMWSARPLRLALRGLGVAVPDTELQQPDGSRYAALPDALAEVASLPRADCPPNLAVTALLQALPRYRYVHFACHGEFVPQSPLHSGLILKRDRLTVARVAQSCLERLDLAVVNACFSGDMQVLPGRELLGMPEALIGSGVGSVIAAQWQAVSATRTGQSSQELFSAFYTRLSTHSPVRALAMAQRDTLAQLPLHLWASYVGYQPGVPPFWPVRLLLRLKPYLPGWLRL